ncbi:hypothetical protein [Candidatus Hodgkinia cicadicola]|uniref:hypothetical protein n=1 Tax=Candidatus Hodgkinia cicadicola TaxID=573658 RepID=UPI0011BA7398
MDFEHVEHGCNSGIDVPENIITTKKQDVLCELIKCYWLNKMRSMQSQTLLLLHVNITNM